MENIPLNHLLDVAICAAEAAGKHALENKDRRNEIAATFTHDVKLVLDVECQRVAEGIIHQEFPDHAILGEEDETPNDSSLYVWIIDPIDGTMNFSHGLEYWCSSIAVRREGRILAGCVYAPDLNAFYTAHVEEPARLNGDPIRVSDTEHLNDSLIMTGLSKEMEETSEPHFEQFRMLALNSKKVRINGAAALDICRVADGTGDAYFQTGIHLWDYAAAKLIVGQAGGKVEVVPHEDERDATTVIASNPNLMSGLKAIYTKCI
jgi:myo-inositol-1(or 4)-monophosphatase